MKKNSSKDDACYSVISPLSASESITGGEKLWFNRLWSQRPNLFMYFVKFLILINIKLLGHIVEKKICDRKQRNFSFKINFAFLNHQKLP